MKYSRFIQDNESELAVWDRRIRSNIQEIARSLGVKIFIQSKNILLIFKEENKCIQLLLFWHFF